MVLIFPSTTHYLFEMLTHLKGTKVNLTLVKEHHKYEYNWSMSYHPNATIYCNHIVTKHNLFNYIFFFSTCLSTYNVAIWTITCAIIYIKFTFNSKPIKLMPSQSNVFSFKVLKNKIISVAKWYYDRNWTLVQTLGSCNGQHNQDFYNDDKIL